MEAGKYEYRCVVSMVVVLLWYWYGIGMVLVWRRRGIGMEIGMALV